MKYLKTYENYSKSDISSEIKDIFSDMIYDDNIEIDIRFKKDGWFLKNKDIIEINFIVKKQGIKNALEPLNHIESFDHLNSFLESEGYVYFSNGSFYKTYQERIKSLNHKVSLMTFNYIKNELDTIDLKNEELKSDTYKSAANKLAGMGHVKRPEELMKWYSVAKEKEEIEKEKARLKAEEEKLRLLEESKRKALEESSKLGTYKITIKCDGKSFTGDFFIYFYWNDDNFSEVYYDWKSFDNHSISLEFPFAVLPASEESKQFFDNILKNEVSITPDGRCYVGAFGLNLTQGGNNYDEQTNKETFVFKPSGDGFYWEHWEADFYMADRASAQRFKKLLYDIFKGDVVLGDTPELPGGVKEKILDHLCSDLDHTLEEFEAFMEYIKQIRVNKIYKD
jgi:hypothetical protein